MRKKWLIAIYASRLSHSFKVWGGKVSEDVEDVTLPQRTMFYFFSSLESPDMEVTQFSNLFALYDSTFSHNLVDDKTFYCPGRKLNGEICVDADDDTIQLTGFTEAARKKGYTIKFV